MSADSGTKTNQTAMTTQPTSKTLGPFRSAANRPAAPAPGSPSRRALAMLTQRPRRRRSELPPLEQLVELALPSALFLGRHQHRDDLLLRQHLDDAWRIRLHVVARWQTSELGEELLALPAEHEVGGKPRRARMWRLGVDADLAEEQRDRIERPHVDRAAGEFDVHRQIHVVVQRYPIFTGAGCARHGQMAVGNHGPQRR